MAYRSDPARQEDTPTSRGGEARADEFDALAAENQRLIEDLEHTRQASLSDRAARDDFLSYAAHELRTPLTLILGYSQAIARRLRDRPEAARELGDLQRVIGATRRLSGMVDEMLDVSRIETGRLRLSIRPFSLLRVAEAAFGRVPDERVVQLEGDPNLPAALGDEARTTQAIWSLVRNALWVTDPDLPVRISLEAEQKRVTATVLDHGPSIPDEELPRIFDVSFIYPAVADKREGLGLGLFVARGIARAMGGDVWHERSSATQRTGNCFVLSLPRADREAGRDAA